jgi:hypothetical protein
MCSCILAQAQVRAPNPGLEVPAVLEADTTQDRFRALGLRRASGAIPRRRTYHSYAANRTPAHLARLPVPRDRPPEFGAPPTLLSPQPRRFAPRGSRVDHGRLALLLSSDAPLPPARSGEETRPADHPRTLARAHRRGGAVGFLRGCIRSDGCIFINPTGKFRYLSYEFANRSCDIRTLFTKTLDLVGVHPRGSRPHLPPWQRPTHGRKRRNQALNDARVGRRADVAERQTRWLQEPLGATPWRFESSHPHF